MDTLTGKARGILLRLPHFFGPAEAGELLRQFVDVFGRSLERAEADLYQVLRAHHVETADNEAVPLPSAVGQRRGDLDRIFSLYVEVLGGTSQLVKMSPTLTRRSLDPRRMARILLEEQDHPLLPYLRERLDAETWDLLRRYHVESTRFAPEEVEPGLAVELLVGRTPLSRYLRDRLRPETREMLGRFDGSATVPSRLAAAVAEDLDRNVLPDPALYRSHRELFDSLPLPPAAALLRSGIYRGLLREDLASLERKLARKDLPEEERIAREEEHQRLLEQLASAEPVPSPPGDDLRRLNRMLLEAAYARDPQARPWGLRPRDIPSLEQVLVGLVEALHDRVLHDETLFRPERFPEAAPEIGALRARYQNRTAWVNRKLLESAFPDAIERSHAPYRERLTGLIQVLRRGASTRQGIVDIVAANLGILGDDPAARRARALIEIEEFRPKRVEFFAGEVSFWRPFPVNNPNPERAAPEVRLSMLPGLGKSLANLRITDARTDASVQFSGRLRPQDHLVLKGSTVMVNGITSPQALSGDVPEVPEDDTDWRFDADVVVPGAEAGSERELPIARFDRALDRSDPTTGKPAGTFDNAVLAPSRPAVSVQVSSYKPDPGIFTVVIPWEIPGFTDKFDAQDHPRQQIRGLVDRVKAAGVQALVAYKLIFAEQHAVEVSLRHLAVEGALLGEENAPDDALRMESDQRVREDTAVQDSIVVSGCLDFTRFDSLNTFA